MLIDCVFLIFSSGYFAIEDAGARIQVAVASPEPLARMLRSEDLREKGWATDMSGGLDAELVASYMNAVVDPMAWRLSHAGWG